MSSVDAPLRTWAAILLVAAGLLGAGWARAQSASSDQQTAAVGNPPAQESAVQPSYRLGAGDKLRITVFGQKDLTGTYQVDGAGLLSFPLVGQIPAGGLTADQLGQSLVSRLKPDYLKDPSVSVEVLTYRPFYVVGEVKTPGGYPYVANMTVLNAVALAGGFTYRARENSFYVTRSDKDGGKVKLDATPDTPVEPGDVITVRERYF
jgi:polysaccharide export outer membrane protein